MKILINVLHLPEKIVGGTEIMTHNIAMNLAKRQHKVFVVTMHEKGLPQRKFTNGYFIHRIKRVRIPILGSLLYSFFFLFAVMKIKPDIIHSQGILYECLLVSKFTNKPYIVWGRGSDVYGTSILFRNLIAKPVLNNASVILALTKDMKKELDKLSNRKTIVLPNGINVDEIQKVIAQVPEKRFGKKQLLFVGNVRSVKGVEYLVNAMRWVVEKETEARLVIVGWYPSDFVQKIPKNLRDKIILTGFVDHDEIPMYMKGSDVFVLPSLSEGFPNVLLEAMAAGLPIVATSVGGIPEIVQNDKNGFLVEPRNARLLAEKVILLLRNKDLREEIGRNNRSNVRNYDIDTIVSEFNRLACSLLN